MLGYEGDRREVIMRNLRGLLFFVAAAFFIATPAVAQSVADFYKGKQLILIVGASTGGGYDAQGRLLARHIGKHIPGNPNVIVQNMPGAGSLQATNHLYNVAPKDGTVFGLIQRDMLVAKVMNASGIRFDIEKFNWIGNLASEIGIVVAWHTSPIKTTEDLFKTEMIVGGTGPTIDTETAPRLMNALIGTKFRIVSGYQGTTEVLLAMERGEVMGLGDWSLSNIRSRNPHMLQEGKIRLLMQTALKKSPDLPDVPLALDFAKSPEDRQVMEAFLAQKSVARPVLAPPGIPADRVQALRAAFMATAADPEFIKDAEKSRLEVSPTSGAEVERVIADITRVPPNLAERLKAAISVSTP
jgi:tripartite-type tricarboxylate transporter receptor subunit TctC